MCVFTLTHSLTRLPLQVDLIAEMRFPKQFNKSIWLSQIFMYCNYSLVAFLGYHAYGSNVKSPITLNMPDDGVNIATNVLLFIHMMIAYLINSTVITQAGVRFLWPGQLEQDGKGIAWRWGLVRLCGDAIAHAYFNQIDASLLIASPTCMTH